VGLISFRISGPAEPNEDGNKIDGPADKKNKDKTMN